MLLKYQNLSGAKGRLNEIKFYFHGIPAGFNYRLAANPYRAGLLHSGRSTRPPPHKGPKAQSLRLMHTLTLPFAHARPSATGTADRGNVSVLFPHIFPTGRQTRDPSLRGRFPAASAAVPRKGKRRRGCSGGKEAGLPASSSRSDEQRPGSRWSGPTHAPGLSASPTRERSRPEIFWFPSLPPLLFFQAPKPAIARPRSAASSVPPPAPSLPPHRQQPPGSTRLPAPPPPPPLSGGWKDPRPRGAPAPPRPPAAAKAAATCSERRPSPRRSLPLFQSARSLGPRLTRTVVLKGPLPLVVAHTAPARRLALGSAARRDEDAGGWRREGATPRASEGWGVRRRTMAARSLRRRCSPPLRAGPR